MTGTIKNIFYVFTASTFSKLIGVFTAVILPKLLDPDSYGVWVTLLLIPSYAPIASLGIVEALLKQYPYYIGKGEDKNARQYEETVLGSICITAVFLIICSLLIPFIVEKTFLYAYQQDVIMMFMIAAISSFSGFFYFRYNAHHNFKASSIIDTLRAIVTPILLLVFTWLWGLKGAVIAYLTAEMVVCISSAILNVQLFGKVKIRLDKKKIWQAIKIGFPITVIWWIYTLQSSAGRVVSITMLGKTMTGYYSLGGSIITMIVLIPMAIGSVLYPSVSEGLGKNLGKEDMALLVITPVQALSLALPLAIGALILLSPVIYHLVFPKYINGLLSAQILLLGAFFSCLIRTGANFLIANGKQNSVILYVAISLITVVMASVLLVKIGLGIEGIALGTSLSGMVFTTFIWKDVFKYFGYNIMGQLKQLLNLYAPFFLLLGLLGILMLLEPNLLVNKGHSAIIFTLIFTILFITIITLSPPFSKTGRELFQLIKQKH